MCVFLRNLDATIWRYEHEEKNCAIEIGMIEATNEIEIV